MLGVRYEEHNDFADNLPFALECSILRSRETNSREANWHDALEIQLCTSGSGVLLIDGEKYNFTENDIAVVNYQTIHHTGTSNRMEYDCLIIDSEFCRTADIDPRELQFDCIIKDDKLRSWFTEFKVLYNGDELCRIAKLRVYLLRMLIYLRENYVVYEKKQIRRSTEYEIAKKTIIYIRENFAERLSIDMIAGNVMINKCTLSRVFKQLTGQTIVEYINGYRCSMAAECISGGMIISDAARLCGFKNMSFFTKTFKHVLGRLPSEYKQR